MKVSVTLKYLRVFYSFFTDTTLDRHTHTVYDSGRLISTYLVASVRGLGTPSPSPVWFGAGGEGISKVLSALARSLERDEEEDEEDRIVTKSSRACIRDSWVTLSSPGCGNMPLVRSALQHVSHTHRKTLTEAGFGP